MEDHDLSVDDLMDSAIKTAVRCNCNSTCSTKKCPCKALSSDCTRACTCGTKTKCCRNNKPVSYFNFKSSAKHILLYSISRPMSKQSENLVEISLWCFRRCKRWIRKKKWSVGRLCVIFALQSVCLGIILFSNLAKTYGSYTKFHLLLSAGRTFWGLPKDYTKIQYN